jgi:hypothetical protein
MAISMFKMFNTNQELLSIAFRDTLDKQFISIAVFSAVKKIWIFSLQESLGISVLRAIFSASSGYAVRFSW